jgi:hypothetical protein
MRSCRGGYTVVTRWLHGGYTVVTRRLHGGYMAVTCPLRGAVCIRSLSADSSMASMVTPSAASQAQPSPTIPRESACSGWLCRCGSRCGSSGYRCGSRCGFQWLQMWLRACSRMVSRVSSKAMASVIPGASESPSPPHSAIEVTCHIRKVVPPLGDRGDLTSQRVLSEDIRKKCAASLKSARRLYRAKVRHSAGAGQG